MLCYMTNISDMLKPVRNLIFFLIVGLQKCRKKKQTYNQDFSAVYLLSILLEAITNLP